MDRRTYFMSAMQADKYKERKWVIGAFSVSYASHPNPQVPAKHLDIRQTPMAVEYYDGEADLWQPITGCKVGEPPFNLMQGIALKAGELPNVKQDMTVSLGNVLFNLCAISSAFGDKIPFVQGEVKVGALEDFIAKRLKSTPKAGEARSPTDIYVDEYITFADSFNYLTEFNQLCTWGLTHKLVVAPTGVKELRGKLIEENKENLKDPLVVAKIDKALMELDKQHLAGDPGEAFLLSKKSRNVVRKKLFLDYGLEKGLSKDYKYDMIANSLSEGWDLSQMPQMFNALRAASTDRGSETQKGGEATKWIYRAASNINITMDDCGTKTGLVLTVTKENLNKVAGFYVASEKGYKLVEDVQEAGSYLGKKLMVRSPLYCKKSLTDYCKVCVGKALGVNPNGAATAVAKLGSTFLALSLKAAHTKELALNTVDLQTAIS